jgi:DNA gyrase/topoisomerase IV subunit A
MIKRTKLEDLSISKSAKISTIMNLDKDDEVVSCFTMSPHEENANIFVVTHTGKGLIYPIKQVTVTGKNSAGVANTGIKDETIVSIGLTNEKEYLCLVCNLGMKRIKFSEISVGNRTNSPKSLIATVKSNPIIVLTAQSVAISAIISYLDASQQ